METFNTFADRMKNIGVMNYLKVRENVGLGNLRLRCLFLKIAGLSDEVGSQVKGITEG